MPASPEDETFYSGAGATNTVDNLIAAGRIRAPVVVFISDNRTSFPGVAATDRTDLYARALATELLPWLRSQYALSSDPKDVVIGGYSAGGGMAAQIAVAYPALFGNLLMQSSGGGAPVISAFERAPKRDVRVYFDPDWYRFFPWDPAARDKAVAGVQASRMRVVDIMREKGYDVIVRESYGGHDVTHWAATLAEALMALLPPP